MQKIQKKTKTQNKIKITANQETKGSNRGSEQQ